MFNIVTWMTTALLSNGSAKNLNNRKNVFYVVRAVTVAMQWFGKHVSTIEAVFAWSVLKIYRGQRRLFEVCSR
jgi:hypothetical protein